MESSAKLARREYMRQWRAKNKNKVKLIQERYWEKRAEQMQKDGKVY